ncbi:hypothetical protein R1sor_020904 [Riccia sorocarpa]|uniref:DUF1664 domain-containing protein n=1 Tax=Riccia sorocarpa TaxID=122646 RepID=A0ABD3GG91_9MARC
MKSTEQRATLLQQQRGRGKGRENACGGVRGRSQVFCSGWWFRGSVGDCQLDSSLLLLLPLPQGAFSIPRVVEQGTDQYHLQESKRRIMAMQAGMGASKVLILVGAGVGGSLVLRNSKISDLLSDLSRVLAKHLQDDAERPSGSGVDSTEALTAQVRRLTMELRQLAASNRPITVVNSSPGSGGNFGSLIVPAAVVGAAGYGYMWLKGWSFSDIMYVTRRNMSNAVASMSKQLETFSAALVATKKHLSLRLDSVTKSLEHNTALTHAIQAQVGHVRGEVAQVGLEMREVQRQIEGLEGKIDEVQGKQDFTNQGIVLLCRFVLEGVGGGGNPELLQGFHAYSRTTRLERSASTTFAVPAGLKDIQSYTEKLMIQTSPSALDANSATGKTSSNFQRSLTASPFAGIYSRPYTKT